MKQMWYDTAGFRQVNDNDVEGVVKTVWCDRYPHQIADVRSPAKLPDVRHILYSRTMTDTTKTKLLATRSKSCSRGYKRGIYTSVHKYSMREPQAAP